MKKKIEKNFKKISKKKKKKKHILKNTKRRSDLKIRSQKQIFIQTQPFKNNTFK